MVTRQIRDSPNNFAVAVECENDGTSSNLMYQNDGEAGECFKDCRGYWACEPKFVDQLMRAMPLSTLCNRVKAWTYWMTGQADHCPVCIPSEWFCSFFAGSSETSRFLDSFLHSDFVSFLYSYVWM